MPRAAQTTNLGDNTMEAQSLEQLPRVVSDISAKVDWIAECLNTALGNQQPDKEHTMLNAQEAATLLGKAVTTIYSMTSERRIPFHKRGNKLYFFKDELMQWITDGGQSGCASDTDMENHLKVMQSGKRRKPASIQ